MTTGDAAEPTLTRSNSVTYMQIPAIHKRASAAFYAAVFGWTVRGDAHVSFDDASGYLSGSFEADRAVSSEPGIRPYIYVDHIDETLARVTEQGGEVVRAPYPEGDLWVATFRDVAGNVMGVWHMGAR